MSTESMRDSQPETTSRESRRATLTCRREECPPAQNSVLPHLPRQLSVQITKSFAHPFDRPRCLKLMGTQMSGRRTHVRRQARTLPRTSESPLRCRLQGRLGQPGFCCRQRNEILCCISIGRLGGRVKGGVLPSSCGT